MKGRNRGALAACGAFIVLAVCVQLDLFDFGALLMVVVAPSLILMAMLGLCRGEWCMGTHSLVFFTFCYILPAIYLAVIGYVVGRVAERR